jgi:ferredoxin/flavodoxin---NADP+ reductase
MIGRRGPAHAKFTTKELRELGELPGVEVSVDEAEMALSGGFDLSDASASLAESDRRVRGNLVAMNEWLAARVAAEAAAGPASQRRLRVRFWLRPTEIHPSPSGTVGGVSLERTRLTQDGKLEGTGEIETLEAQLVLRSVGYQSVPLAGVPFNSRSHTVPNAAGRVLGADGAPLPGEYVAGWLKRGPTGVIGTNKADAAETVRSLLADLAGAPDSSGAAAGPGGAAAAPPRPGLLKFPDPDPAEPQVPSPLAPVLLGRGVSPVSYEEWLRIEAAEESLAAQLGRGDRVKLPGRDAIWSACRPGPETP